MNKLIYQSQKIQKTLYCQNGVIEQRLFFKQRGRVRKIQTRLRQESKSCDEGRYDVAKRRRKGI